MKTAPGTIVGKLRLSAFMMCYYRGHTDYFVKKNASKRGLRVEVLFDAKYFESSESCEIEYFFFTK